MTDEAGFQPDRRRCLQAVALAGAAGLAGCQREPAAAYVEDVARIEPMPVGRIARPASSAELRDLIGQSSGPISIGGARYSMGGQIAAPDSLHVDMRGMNRLIHLDPARLRARVQAGMRWRDLLDRLDPHDLSVRIMQSYSNFSIGGSVSVNCHGRYVGAGPLAHAIRVLRLITADGAEHELSREQQPDGFAAVIGGYGGLGVISEIELDLALNHRIERHAQHVALADYPDWFREHVQANPDATLHNADLVPPDFNQPLAITWQRSDAALTHAERLIPRGLDYSREQNQIWSVSELPGGNAMRDRFQTERLLQERVVQMRNREASLDAASLEPRTRRFSTYLLQEYFLPVAQFGTFARRMASVLKRFDVQALNVSIRHAPADRDSLLKWAPTEVFSFVLYHKQRAWPDADQRAAIWTRELIDSALALGGRYYLPYRRHATREQFTAAYPEAARFAALKRQMDPQHRFRNHLWDTYLG